MGSKSIVSLVIMLAMVGSVFGTGISFAKANQSAPDSMGYYWVDSRSPAPMVAFNWTEINTTGTDTTLSGDNDWAGPLDIGFSFYYYGNIYTQFYPSSDGYIQFGTGSYDSSNDELPDYWTPNNIICAYWDDLDVDPYYNGKVYYQTIGSSPNMMLVVEYVNVTRDYYSDLMTFEIILYENGDILLQYLELSGVDGYYGTVGIENSDGYVGLTYCYYSYYYYLQNQLAILFTMGPVLFGPDQTQSGIPAETLSYQVRVWNRQSVADTFEINYSTVLGWTVDITDTSYVPLSDSNSNGIIDTGLLAPNANLTLKVNVTIPLSPAAQWETTTLNASSYNNATVWDLCVLSSSVMDAWLAPPHTDYGRDTDSDSLWNYLVLEISMEVMYTDYYYFEGYLYTGLGGYITYDTNYTYLTAGVHTVELTYFGWLIRDTGTDGPYRIDLDLYDSSWNLIDTGTHWTAAYLASEFMQVPASFSPPHSDTGVDSDSDGLYESLRVDVVLDIVYDGTYIVSGNIYRTDWIDSDQVTVDLLAGIRTVSLSFDAWEIYQSGGDGPYTVYLNLYAYVDWTSQYLEGATYYTQVYSVYAFDGPGAYFWSPHSDYVTDTDSDGLYNWLIVQVLVNVTVAGTYTVIGELRADSWDDLIFICTNGSLSLPIGIQMINLSFPGWPINYQSNSDDMDIELSLFDVNSVLLDEDYYVTPTYYYYYDFEGPPALFAPPHESYASDLNGDSMLDYVIVNVSVNVEVAGTYTISAEIYDDWWDVIDTLDNTTWLDAGVQVVELRFPGWVIRDHGDSGPYTVDMILLDEGGRECDYGSHLTAAYTWDQFQTDPILFNPPHFDYGEDTDSDSLYEYLVIGVNLTVVVAGDYRIDSYLYDTYGSNVLDAQDSFTLAEGSQTVFLKFPAWVLALNDVDGYFDADLYLYDGSGNYLSYDSYTTASYLMADFDGEMPEIMSSWTYSPPSVNGYLSDGEWYNATVVDLVSVDPNNEVEATLMFLNDNVNLYIAVDVWGDLWEDSSDESSVSFDTGNDGLTSDGGEDIFYLQAWNPDTGIHYEYDVGSGWWTTHCSPYDNMLTNHDTLLGAVGFGPSPDHGANHRIFEYSIPLALIDASPGDVVGFLGGSIVSGAVFEDYYWYESWWPMYFDSWPNMAGYGTLLLADSTPPTPPTTTASAAGTSGSNGWFRSNVIVTMTATSMFGIDHTEYSLDGGSWVTYSSPIAVSGEGTHTVQYYSVDIHSLQESTKSLSIKIDTVAPVTTSGVSGAQLWLNSTDATSGRGSTMYRIDNGTWQTYSSVLTVTGEGTHKVDYYSLDAAGNQEATKSVNVVGIPEDNGDGGGGLGTGALILIVGGIVAIVIVALIILLLLMKRKKGQQPVMMAPPPNYIYPPAPPSQ